MTAASQPTLPGVRDWTQPQVITANGLARIISAASSAGFEAARKETSQKPLGYRVTIQRKANLEFVRASKAGFCPLIRGGKSEILP